MDRRDNPEELYKIKLPWMELRFLNNLGLIWYIYMMVKIRIGVGSGARGSQSITSLPTEKIELEKSIHWLLIHKSLTAHIQRVKTFFQVFCVKFAYCAVVLLKCLQIKWILSFEWLNKTLNVLGFSHDLSLLGAWIQKCFCFCKNFVIFKCG